MNTAWALHTVPAGNASSASIGNVIENVPVGLVVPKKMNGGCPGVPLGVTQRKEPGQISSSGGTGGIVIAKANPVFGGALLMKIVSGIVKTGSVELSAGGGTPHPGPSRSTDAKGP